MARNTRSHASTWSYKAGERGRNRVRVSEDPKRDGKLFVEFRERDGRKVRHYLSHTDRERAKQEADAMAAAFGKEPPENRKGPLSLQALFDIYVREVTPTKSRGKQLHDRAAAGQLLSAWGKDRDPLTLGLRDWQRFIADRRSGRLAPKGWKGKRKRKGVGDRQITYDLKFARAVFNWAILAGDGEGGALLERNPCTGFPLPSEGTPRRPRLSEDRYRQMVEVAPAIDPQFHLALVLAHETGHRLSSIRQLRWSDIRWDTEEIRWRSETDKEGNAHTTPLTKTAVDALTAARSRVKAVGDVWIFLEPASGKKPRPRSRYTFLKWWRQAEDRAELEHEERGGWHSLRRKFATELKDIPLPDLCALGGWKSAATILACYQQPDAQTMRRALQNRRVICSPPMESTNGEQSIQNAPTASQQNALPKDVSSGRATG